MLLKLKTGDVVRWDGEEYIVAAIKANELRLTPLRGGTGVWADLTALAGEADFQLVDGAAQGRDRTERFALMLLSKEQQKDVLWWRDHLLEVEHGVNPNDHTPTPRPGYDDPKLTTRRELKAQELTAVGVPVSAKTLLRKWQAYQRDGVNGLLDQRSQRTVSVPRVDDRIERIVLEVLSETTEQSTVTMKVLMAHVKTRVERAHPGVDIPWPSDSTLRRLMKAYDHRDRATGKATTRRTEANRPDRQFNPVAAYYPGQYVEADSSPFNFDVRNPDGSLTRSKLHVMIDVATRSIVSWAITPDAANGYDLSLMLARALRPRTVRGTMPKHTWMTEAPFLPHADLVAIDDAFTRAVAVPFIVPESITTDQGRDYRSNTFVEACRAFGISVVPAPPGSPDAKPNVERLMKTIETKFMQYVEGYLGNSVANRGRKLTEKPLTLCELDDLFAEFVVIYQNTPHPALRDRNEPDRPLSPNQTYTRLFDACGGVPVPIDEGTYIALMPMKERGIRSDGVHVNKERYDSPALNGVRGRPGRYPLHYDPYDGDRIWIRHPDTMAWVECRNVTLRAEEVPFGQDRPLIVNPKAVVFTHDDWVKKQLNRRYDKADAATKSSRSPKSTSKDRKAIAVRERDSDLRPPPLSSATSEPDTSERQPMRSPTGHIDGFDYKEAWDA